MRLWPGMKVLWGWHVPAARRAGAAGLWWSGLDEGEAAFAGGGGVEEGDRGASGGGKGQGRRGNEGVSMWRYAMGHTGTLIDHGS